MLSTNVNSAVPSASQRAACGRPLPTMRVSAPPRIGSQISKLSRGQFATRQVPYVDSAPARSGPKPDQHGQQCNQAEDHREGVVVEVSGLHATDDTGDEVDN